MAHNHHQQLTLNQRVAGSSPAAPTIPSNSGSNWTGHPSNFVFVLCSRSFRMAFWAISLVRGR